MWDKLKKFILEETEDEEMQSIEEEIARINKPIDASKDAKLSDTPVKNIDRKESERKAIKDFFPETSNPESTFPGVSRVIIENSSDQQKSNAEKSDTLVYRKNIQVTNNAYVNAKPIEDRKFKPSKFISPVYGVKGEVNKEDSNDILEFDRIRKKAFKEAEDSNISKASRVEKQEKFYLEDTVVDLDGTLRFEMPLDSQGAEVDSSTVSIQSVDEKFTTYGKEFNTKVSIPNIVSDDLNERNLFSIIDQMQNDDE